MKPSTVTKFFENDPTYPDYENEDTMKLSEINPTFFECEAGWHKLVETTLLKIKEIVERDNLYIEVLQVKEKYGGLRIYLSTYTPEIETIIADAESGSVTICEICGEPGSFYSDLDGWYMTRCLKCLHSGLFELEKD